MKKSLLALIPAALLVLASCSLIDNLPDFGDEDEDPEYSQGSQEEFKEPSVEELNKKYSGFEVTYLYTYTNDIIKVGGKGNTYWYTSADPESTSYDTATVTTVNGSTYENVSYSDGEPYNMDTEDQNLAALIADSNYLGYGQHGGILENYEYTSATISGEAAKKYSVATMEIYVSKTYGITLQIDYQDGDSIKFQSIKKGNDVQIPQVEE